MRAVRRLAGPALALLLMCGCGGHPAHLAGDVAPVGQSSSTGDSSASPSRPPSSPSSPSTPVYEAYRFDAAQGNATQTTPIFEVPEGWDPSVNGSLHDFRGPDGALLRLDFRRPTPSALSNWAAVEQDFAKEHTDYERQTMHTVDCPQGAVDCADWTFSYTKDGVPTQAYDRGVVVNDTFGFAFLISGPQSQAAQLRQIFDHVAASIRFSS